ncbi:MAG: response regulator [Rudaea sp.]
MSRMLNVLIVEDDPSLGIVTAEALSSAGHTTTLVATVVDALATLRAAHTFDVILLDLRIGEERGETVFEKLQLLRVKYPPVVILSAQPEIELRKAGVSIQTKHVLSKPTSIARIIQVIEEAVVA